MALINTERPITLKEVKGQGEIIQALSNDLIKKNIKGAYLFSGTRGTGKTTLARIFARSLNCERPDADGSPCNHCKACTEILSRFSVDVYELDAASHNSVDDVRDIIQKVAFKPFFKYTVVIMDEVHMLSQTAFNALLKTLEEPPKNVVFILCTTEKHRVPATIISRCSCYNFKKMSFSVIVEHLQEVIRKFQDKGHKINYEDNAIAMIAKAANGGMRDALSILDNFFTMEYISTDAVAKHLDISDDDVIFAILDGIAQKNPSLSIEAVKAAAEKDISFSFMIKRIFETLLDVVDLKSSEDCDSIIGTEFYQNSVRELSLKLTTAKAFQILDEFRKIHQISSDNLELSIISAVLALIYQNNCIDELYSEINNLRKEVEELKKYKVAVPVDRIAVDSKSNKFAVEKPDTGSLEQKELVEHDINSASAYCENMEGDYDAAFTYEEEEPCFINVIPDSNPTQSITEKKQTLSTEQQSTSQIPDGISFEQLENLDFQRTEDTPFESEDTSETNEETVTEDAENISFFGDLFSSFVRQSY